MKYSALKLRTATVKDVDDIVEINNAYLEYHNSTGVIISKLEKGQLEKNILGDPESIRVAVASENLLVGFIDLSASVGRGVLKNLKWFDESIKKNFEVENCLYIEKAAVKNGYQRQNVGKFMYEAVFGKYPEHTFYSFVIIKPFNNIVSMNFHKKMGFIESARFEAEEFLGLRDYESIMLMKMPIHI